MAEWPKLKRDYKGLKVKTLVPLNNRFMEIPAGTVCVVQEAWSYWVTLGTEPCPHCGVRVFIRKVPCREVALQEQEEV